MEGLHHPFLKYKSRIRSFQQKSKRENWTDCQTTLSCFWLLISVSLAPVSRSGVSA